MKKTIEFEQAIKELEEIVTQLESNELPLEKSIALFDQGTKLSSICSQKLEEAQQKIETLIAEMNKTKNP